MSIYIRQLSPRYIRVLLPAKCNNTSTSMFRVQNGLCERASSISHFLSLEQLSALLWNLITIKVDTHCRRVCPPPSLSYPVLKHNPDECAPFSHRLLDAVTSILSPGMPSECLDHSPCTATRRPLLPEEDVLWWCVPQHSPTPKSPSLPPLPIRESDFESHENSSARPRAHPALFSPPLPLPGCHGIQLLA